MFLKHVLGTGSNIRHLPCKSDPIPRRHRLCRAVLHKGGSRGSWSRDCTLRHGAIGASSYTCLISSPTCTFGDKFSPDSTGHICCQLSRSCNHNATCFSHCTARARWRSQHRVQAVERVLARTLSFLSIYCLKMMVVGMAGGARRVVSVSFFITTVVGTLMTIFLVAFTKPLIRIFTGGSGAAELTIDMYGHAPRTLVRNTISGHSRAICFHV
jgi:hypothetical protein